MAAFLEADEKKHHTVEGKNLELQVALAAEGSLPSAEVTPGADR